MLLWLAIWLGAAAWPSEAEDLLRRGRVLDALPVAQAEAEAAPGDVEAWERWIDLLVSTGQAGRARAEVAARIARDPTNPDLHVLAGRAEAEVAGSLAHYERALSFDPDHARAHAGIADLHRSTGSLRSAAASYQRALRTDPTLGPAWGGLLATLLTSGDREGALQVASAALAVVPDHIGALLAVVSLDPARRAEALTRAQQVAPWDLRVNVAVAEAALRAGDADTAAKAADTALTVDPLSRVARRSRWIAREVSRGALDGEGAAQVIDHADDLATLDALVARYPLAAVPRLIRARKLLDDGDTAAARTDLERALALDSANAEVRATLGLLDLADGQIEAAADRLGPVALDRPFDAKLAVAAARAQQEAGRIQAARATLDAARKARPFDLEVTLRFVGVLSASGDREAAYRAAAAATDRIRDPRLELAVAAAAHEAGHLREAADRYDRLAEALGEPKLTEVARNIRRKADEASETP